MRLSIPHSQCFSNLKFGSQYSTMHPRYRCKFGHVFLKRKELLGVATVVPSTIGYSHTCNSAALTSTSILVSLHVRTHMISNVESHVRTCTCGLMHYAHASHAMCVITMPLTPSSKPYTVECTRISHTYLLTPCAK